MDLAAPTSSSAPAAEGTTMDLTQVLEATLSPDTQQVMHSQKQLEYAAENNLPVFLSALAAQLANVSNSQVSRMAAGLQLKNYLTSKDPAEKLVKQQQWLQFDTTIKQQIKHLVVSTLGTEGQQYKSAAQCVAHIAAVELQMNTWPELIPLLLRNVASPESTEQVKEASLEAIGYVCEDLDPKFLAHQSNEILTAIVQGMRKEEPSNNVRLAATKALLNSLEFTKANFEKENERHFIMQVLCEATQCNCVPIQVAALQNMVRIMSLYYQYMESYMGPALFAITLEAMKSTIDDVALQGIEFWSTVCDEEVDLAIEAADAEDSGHPPAQTSRFYVKGAMDYLIPILLHTLTKQEDYDDEDEWNPCKAAGVCLSLMSNCCEDAILTAVLAFVLQNIISQDWKCRDAAVMALGSVLEGAQGDDVEKKIEQLVEPLIQLMSDEMVQVRDSVAWTIGRVCEHCPKALLQEKNLISLLQAFMVALAGELRVAVNVCWAFSSLVEAAYDMSVMASEDDIPQTFCLSSLYQNIISKLIETGERSDAGSSNLRNAAYEAVMDMIKFSPNDTYEVVQQTALVMLEKLNEGIHMCCNPGVTGASRQQLMDAMSLLLATMQSLLRRLVPNDVAQMSDQVMEKLLQVSMSEGIQEDVMMTVGVLVDVLGETFLKYMEAFFPVLLRGIANVADVQVCLASVGLVGDLCRSISLQLLPLCDQLMTVLFNNLQNSEAHRSIKPPILCALGDIALAIGLKFACYLEVVLNILSQAAQFNVQGSDYDLLEYGNELRDSCLDAYTGIVQSLKDNSADNRESHDVVFAMVSQQLPFMVSYVVSVAVDEDKSDTNLGNALGLMGDLCSVFGTKLDLSVKEIQVALCKLVVQGRKSRTKRTRLVADWASKELSNILQQRPPDTSAK